MEAAVGGCKRVGTKTVQAPVINRFTDGMKPFGDGAGHPYETVGGGEEEQAVYECEPGCPVAKLDEQSGEGVSKQAPRGQAMGYDDDGAVRAHDHVDVVGRGHNDQGGASRFFANFEPDIDAPFIYTGKASKRDKNADLEEEGLINKHPTVKSQALMLYFVRLVTPPGGIVLDPFAGSGSTGVAAATGNFRFILIERETNFWQIAKVRTDKALGRAQSEKAQRDAFEAMAELPEE